MSRTLKLTAEKAPGHNLHINRASFDGFQAWKNIPCEKNFIKAVPLFSVEEIKVLVQKLAKDYRLTASKMDVHQIKTVVYIQKLKYSHEYREAAAYNDC